MLALKVSASLMWLIALGFGAPTPYAARHLLTTGKLPTFIGLFPMYGGGRFERASPRTFVVLLGLFGLLCAFELLVGWKLWNGERAGAQLALVVLPFEAIFWLGFSLPIPPAFALARTILLLVGWSALR